MNFFTLYIWISELSLLTSIKKWKQKENLLSSSFFLSLLSFSGKFSSSVCISYTKNSKLSSSVLLSFLSFHSRYIKPYPSAAHIYFGKSLEHTSSIQRHVLTASYMSFNLFLLWMRSSRISSTQSISISHFLSFTLINISSFSLKA